MEDHLWKISYKASSVWWPSKWDEPPFLTCHCRFRCRSLTLTFQGMSSKLAESLKTLKMFLSHHEDGNPYWNQIYWKYLTLGRLIIHGNWWKGTGTFELARKEHLTLKPLLLYSSQARQSSLVDANSTMIFELIPCGISHSHAFIVPISLL